MGRRIVGGALLAMLALAGPAAASDRYAAPGGSGSAACTVDAPCTLARAASVTGPNDVLRLAGGFYDTSGNGVVIDEPGVQVVGPATGTRARISSDAPGNAALSTLEVRAANVTVRDVDLVHRDGTSARVPLYQASGGTNLTVDRVRATATGGTSAAMYLAANDALVSNSVATVAEGGVAAIYATATGTRLHNVTAIAQAGNGLLVAPPPLGPNATYRVAVHNSILVARDDVPDLRMQGSAFQPVEVTLGSSAVDVDNAGPSNTVAETGVRLRGDTSVQGDGTQSSGSPTIDRGNPAQVVGTLDAFGNPRVSGAAVDIGAHERQVRADAPSRPSTQVREPVVIPPGPPTENVPMVPVGLDAVKLSRTRFRAGAKGVRLSWTLSRPATVNLTVLQKTRGIKRGSTCRAAKRPGRGKKACRYDRVVGKVVRVPSQAGAGSAAFTGKGLRRGAYTLSVVATDAVGARSPTRRVTFAIVRR